MPVKKPVEESMCQSHSGSCGCNKVMWSTYGSMGRKLMCTLLGILLVYGIVLVGTLIRNNLKKYNAIGLADKTERTITVDAEGKVTVTPDIAITTMGMTAEGKTVAEAQQKNTNVINGLLEKVKALGVDKKDVQTANYNIYPLYDYKDNKQTIRGYQVSQSVTIKIRDLNKANQVIALAGDVGANNVSGLQFTVDDREAFKEQARQIALKKVAEKRLSLARSLGVSLQSVVSYNEYEVNGDVNGKANYNYGATADTLSANSAPTVEPGTDAVVMHVSVIFEVQ